MLLSEAASWTAYQTAIAAQAAAQLAKDDAARHVAIKDAQAALLASIQESSPEYVLAEQAYADAAASGDVDQIRSALTARNAALVAARTNV